IIRRTQRQLWLGLVLAAPFLAALLALIFSDTPGWRIFSGGPLLLFGVLILVNYIKGPGCAVQVQTSVSLTELTALKRLKKTEAILAEVRPRIAAVQGEIDRETLPAAWEARSSSHAAARASSAVVEAD